MKIIGSPWFHAVGGGMLFAGVFFSLLVQSTPRWAPEPAASGPSILEALPERLELDFDDEPIEDLINHLSAREDALRAKEAALEQTRQTLERERAELELLRADYEAYEARIERVVFKVDEIERKQLGKLADIYAEMDTGLTVNVLAEMPEEKMVKLLSLMPEETVKRLFEQMMAGGESEALAAQRVAELSNKLLRSFPAAEIEKP